MTENRISWKILDWLMEGVDHENIGWMGFVRDAEKRTIISDDDAMDRVF